MLQTDHHAAAAQYLKRADPSTEPFKALRALLSFLLKWLIERLLCMLGELTILG